MKPSKPAPVRYSVLPSVIAVGVLGLACFTWAWHGKRIDATPFCRKCRFDLSGLCAGGSLPASLICPECGREVSRHRHLRIGRRRRRRRALLVGALLLLPALWTAIYTTLGKPNLYAYTPLAVLKLEAAYFPESIGDAAIQELLARDADGRAPLEQWADAVLPRCVDRTCSPAVFAPSIGPWGTGYADPPWLRVVRLAIDDDLLDERQHARLRDALTDSLVWQVDEQTLLLHSFGVVPPHPSRVGTALELLGYSIEAVCIEMRVNGEPAEPMRIARARSITDLQDQSRLRVANSALVRATHPFTGQVGAHTIEAKWRLSIDLQPHRNQHPRREPSPDFVVERWMSASIRVDQPNLDSWPDPESEQSEVRHDTGDLDEPRLRPTSGYSEKPGQWWVWAEAPLSNGQTHATIYWAIEREGSREYSTNVVHRFAGPAVVGELFWNDQGVRRPLTESALIDEPIRLWLLSPGDQQAGFAEVLVPFGLERIELIIVPDTGPTDDPSVDTVWDREIHLEVALDWDDVGEGDATDADATDDPYSQSD